MFCDTPSLRLLGQTCEGVTRRTSVLGAEGKCTPKDSKFRERVDK